MLLLLFSLAATAAAAVAQPREHVHAPSGVRLVFGKEAGMYPADWLAPPISGKASDPPADQVGRSQTLMLRALEKYPAELLRRELKAVYLLGQLEFYGVSYGGTNSTDKLFLTNRGASQGYTDRYVEQSFHHEFSSILLRNYPRRVDRASWASQNGRGYGQSGTEAIRQGRASTEFSAWWHQLGFLYQYASSDFENDFNSVAENLFCPAPGFWQAVEAYPALAHKARLAIAFYQSLSPRLNEAYFRSLAR